MIRPFLQLLNEEAHHVEQDIGSIDEQIKALETERTNELLQLEAITEEAACLLHNVNSKEEARLFINESINYEIELLTIKQMRL